MATAIGNWWKNLENMSPMQKVTYPIRAAQNVYGRVAELPQYTYGAGGVPSNSTLKNMVRALRPQTAYANDQSQMGQWKKFDVRKKADGGYDYYINGNQASLEHYYLAGGEIPADEPTIKNNSIPLQNSITGGDGDGDGTESRLAVFGGITYDLNDPVQREAYYNAQRMYAEDMYNQNLTTLDRTYGQLGENVNLQEQDLNRTYGEQTTALQEALRRGLFRSANYYDRIAPSLYQTAEGVSKQEKQTGYNENLGTLNREKERAEGEIARARSDINYYQPLEREQYGQQRQSVLDQIIQDKYSTEADISDALATQSQINPAAYNIAYNAPNQYELNASIMGTPTGGASLDPTTGLRKTTGAVPKTIEEYLYQSGY